MKKFFVTAKNPTRKPSRARGGRGLTRFISFFIALAIVGVALSPIGSFRASAQIFIPFVHPPVDPETGLVTGNNFAGALGNVDTSSGEVTQGTNGPGYKAAAAQNNGAPRNTLEPEGCLVNPLTSGGAFFNLDACLVGVMNIIMWLVSWILFIAGLCFDAAMYFTIHLSDLINGDPGIPVVTVGWTILRDLANIFFIFILLWMAIGTILGLNSGKTKGLLVHLIVVAFLLNFSLFITQAVIDASNIIAVHFYNQVPGSYSGAFMEGLKLQTLYDGSALNSTGLDRLQNGLAGLALGGPGGALIGLISKGGNPATMLRIIFMGVFGSILMLTAAYVFFTAAILFLIRIVSLMFVMLLSPLAFVSFALPATEEYGRKWRDLLIKQSFFAPAFLVLSYIVVRTIQSPPFQHIMTVTSTSGGFLTVLYASNQFMPFIMIIVNYLILIGLMLGCILIAKELDAVGVEAAVHIGKQARGFVGRQIFRGTPIVAGATATQWIASKAAGGAERLGLQGLSKTLKGVAKSKYVNPEKVRKAVDINEINKNLGQTTFGKSALGDFLLEHTARKMTKAKFGSEKSVKEAYEEDIKRRAGLEEVKKKNTALDLGKKMENTRQEYEAHKMPTVEKFTNKNGVFDLAGYTAAMQKFNETYGPERENYPAGPAGDSEFAAAKTQYEAALKTAPKRDAKNAAGVAIYGAGTAGDKMFAAALAKHAEDNFAKPSSTVYSPAALARANKMAVDHDAQEKIWKDNYEEAETAVGSAVSFITPQGFADMKESDIHRLAKYANVGQIDAVLKNLEFTTDEKREMLDPWAGDHVRYFEEFGKKLEEFDRDQHELEKVINSTGPGKIDIDIEGKVIEGDIKDDSGTVIKRQKIADGKITVTDAAGRVLSETKQPVPPPLDGKERAWARNAMTVHAYEDLYLLNPDAFKSRGLVEVMRWGHVFKDLRFSNVLDAKTRESLSRDLKDAATKPVINKEMPENSDAERAAATAAATAAAKRAAQDEENKMLSAPRPVGLSDKQFNDLIEKNKEKKARDALDEVIADMLRKDVLILARMRKWRAGRAATEAISARGATRTNKWFAKIVDRKVFDLAHDGTRDDSDVAVIDANILVSKLKDDLGIEEMTPENKEALRYWMEEQKGRELPLINLDAMDTKHAEQLGFKDGKITLAGKIYSYADLRQVYSELREQGKTAAGIEFESEKKKK